jgi:hypothetical protein
VLRGLDALFSLFSSSFGVPGQVLRTPPFVHFVHASKQEPDHMFNMDLNLLSRIILLAIFATCVLSSNLVPRQSCSSGYSLCSPPCATGSSTYDIGDGLVHLYSNLLRTVNPHAPAPGTQPTTVSPNGPAKRQSVNVMCCASGLSCYLLQGSGVPMCYVSILPCPMAPTDNLR